MRRGSKSHTLVSVAVICCSLLAGCADDAEADEARARIAAYLEELAADPIGSEPDECLRWFDRWSVPQLNAQIAAAVLGDEVLAEALASEQAAAGAAVADCLAERSIDREELAAHQSWLSESAG